MMMMMMMMMMFMTAMIMTMNDDFDEGDYESRLMQFIQSYIYRLIFFLPAGGSLHGLAPP